MTLSSWKFEPRAVNKEYWPQNKRCCYIKDKYSFWYQSCVSSSLKSTKNFFESVKVFYFWSILRMIYSFKGGPSFSTLFYIVIKNFPLIQNILYNGIAILRANNQGRRIRSLISLVKFEPSTCLRVEGFIIFINWVFFI